MRKISCKCENCGAELLRKPMDISRYKKFFCNRKCQEAAQVIYDDAALEYLKQNLNKLKFAYICSHIGATKMGLLAQMSKWRTAGEDIPIRKKENRVTPKPRKKAERKPAVHKTDNMSRQIDERTHHGASQIKQAEERPMTIKSFSDYIYKKVDNRTWVVRRV